jgi:hypothetical protein
MVRTAAIVIAALLSAPQAAARLPKAPAAAEPASLTVTGPASSEALAEQVQTSWPSAADATMRGFCIESGGWAPSPQERPRPAMLWDCWGGDNQRLSLEAGVLFVGAAKTAYLTPAQGEQWPGCEVYELPQRKRRYQVEACTDRSRKAEAAVSFSELLSDGEGDAEAPGEGDAVTAGALMRSVLPRGAEAPQLGAPVLAVAVNWRAQPPARWVYDENAQQLRLQGTELCLTAPPAGAEAGAPLYLDSCELPAPRNRIKLIARP